MSDTLFSDAAAKARRAASGSATLLRAVARFGRGAAPASEPEPALEPANETQSAPEPARTSLITARTEMTGTISTPEAVQVEGRIEGDVRASKIVVCAGGVVKGGLVADIIVIHGMVEGRVEGQDVLLCGSAVVNGEITHRSLGIDRTAVFEGNAKRRADEAAVAAE